MNMQLLLETEVAQNIQRINITLKSKYNATR